MMLMSKKGISITPSCLPRLLTKIYPQEDLLDARESLKKRGGALEM